MRITSLCGAVVLVTAMAACDEPRADDGACGCDEVEARSAQVNGGLLNGGLLNGALLNGALLNGGLLNGPNGASDQIQLKQVNVQGDGVAEDARIEGSMLVVTSHQGEELAGLELDDAKLHFEVKEGGTTRQKLLKILDVAPLAPGSDVWLFDVSLKVDSGGWGPMCIDSAGEPTQAILLADVWNPGTGGRMPATASSVTFACRDTALAKCVEWGYRPWLADLHEVHQACTRLVRADYCGDGVAHTQQGTAIHVLDQLGIQGVDPNLQFVVEAEWGPEGAVCLNANNMRLGPQALSCELPACGTPFASGGLLQSGKIVGAP
ncbi:ADYC domain-containing protein [Nannocystis sp. ILAH1]|uniref:ADYC domain-containing protein n=1 Tax=unclassified Nannocystis TaxID=2627009 RepID=UPI00226F8E1D|nr:MULTISPECIES: ADYC domain-containing protein [unclassified Nannocystis]MCY0994900.1 ADYC domain-containing protein [Nannocystis sp. ILAH1]MCY1065271.1 ADYC domain-containing protein [Nannocystis sp. RBIL2]